MNTERILAIADMIEQHTIPWLGFNMGPFFVPAAERDDEGYHEAPDRSGHNCGTVACIAGHAIVLKNNIMNEPKRTEELGSDFLSEAAAYLGLDYPGNAQELFFAEGSGQYRDNIGAEQAVRTLRHLAATGTVDWTV